MVNNSRIKTLSIISVFVLILSGLQCCTQAQRQAVNKQIEISDNFLSEFPDTNAINLHIYAPTEIISGEETGRKFEGKKIDSSFYKYFSTQTWFPDSTGFKSSIFGCYKFQFSKSYEGLIIRRISQYSETAIDLCLWNMNTKKIDCEFKLADSFGDGEWFFVKDAWLTDIDKDGVLDIVTRQKDWTGRDESETGSDIISDSLKVYKFQGICYKQTVIPIDTSKYKLYNWDKENK